MNLTKLPIGLARLLSLAFLSCALGPSVALGASFVLEGQSSGSPTWITGNLQNWKELDYIPCRVAVTGGPINSQTVTVYFPHVLGTTPGFQDLTGFTTSANLAFLSPPVMADPAGADWSYTMTFRVTDGNPAYIQFYARMAAGAHLNTGSSLMLSGSPSSMGNLQIHKPAAGPGQPDLAIRKTGAASVRPGDTFTYTLSYTNKAAMGATTAVGVQISDILPAELTVNPNSISNGGTLVGNTIFWDLGNLAPGGNGLVSFQATVSPSVPYDHSFTNFSQILGSQDDANPADNTSTFVTTTTSCAAPAVVVSPAASASCPGETVIFTAAASGTGPLTYQWLKNGVALAATNSALTLSSVTSDDAATYAVIVNGLCGSATNTATLEIRQGVTISQGPVSLTNCPGTTAAFTVSASGSGLSYQWFWAGGLLPGQTGSSLVLTNVSTNSAGVYSVAVSGSCGSPVTNSASLTVTALPVLTCAAGKTAQLGSSWSFDAPSANYPISIVSTMTNTMAHCGNTFSVTRTWVAMDACGNTSTPCSQTVEVIDTQAPVLDCSSSTNKSVQLGSAWSFDPPTATDNGGTNITLNIVSTVTNTMAHCGNTFSATRTWVALDACGNTSTPCSQTVEVIDTQAPVLDCSSSTNKSVQLGSIWSFDPPTATDNGGTNITLNIVSTVTNTAEYCGNGFSAIRTWVAIDACGNVSTPCSQSVSVIDGNPIRITEPLVDQAACAGTLAAFSIGATGKNLSYAWWFNHAVVATNSTLLLTNLSAANAGVYAVIVSDACGNAVTNSALLTVHPLTSATPLASGVRNLGDSVTFTTVASGTGPFTYVWKKNGAVLSGQTTNSLTLTNLSFADGAVYQVEVSGSCNTAVQGATLTINKPPTVTILSPTNGAVFIAPASFTVLADAYDQDGTVTNVEFFQAGQNKLGETNTAPYFITLTNLPAGSYTFTARATDNLGAQAVSAPVSITVLSNPPLSLISAMRFDPQTGLFTQTVRVTNPTSISYDAVRVYVYNLGSGMRVYNASGATNGVPYVETHNTVPAGGSADLVIEYYVTSSQTPNPTLVPALVEPTLGGGVKALGTTQRIESALLLADKTFLLEFGSVSNRLYYIQYSSDLRVWQQAEPVIIGTGGRMQWIDNGQPKTVSAPADTPVRYYRIIQAQ